MRIEMPGLEVVAKLAVAVAAALLVAASMSPASLAVIGNSSYDEAVVFEDYPVFDLGPTFENLPQTSVNQFRYYPLEGQTFSTFKGPVVLPSEVEPPSDSVLFTYGDCTPVMSAEEYIDSETCALPLMVETWPACIRNPAQYPKPVVGKPLLIRGVPAMIFEDGTRLELYTETVVIVIFGSNEPQLLRAADAVRLVNPIAVMDLPYGTWYLLGLLAPPVPGAIDGNLPCHVPSFAVGAASS